MKKATTVEEQLSKLKERGLDIDCSDKKAIEILSDIGYYRLGFYLFPFEKNYPNLNKRSHDYFDGSKFDDVIRLYYFDSDLRNILLFYMNRIEINFRTKIIYTCSNFYKEDPLWYINDENVDAAFIESIKEEYSKKLIKFSVIKNHRKNYYPNGEFAPAWKTIEFFTFGKVLSLYVSLKSSDLKKEISKLYGIEYTTILENYMTLIVSLRNICAHSNVLFDYKLPKSIKSGPALTTTPSNNSKLYSAILVIKYIVSTISKSSAQNLDEEINDLFKENEDCEVIKKIVNSVMK